MVVFKIGLGLGLGLRGHRQFCEQLSSLDELC